MKYHYILCLVSLVFFQTNSYAESVQIRFGYQKNYVDGSLLSGEYNGAFFGYSYLFQSSNPMSPLSARTELKLVSVQGQAKSANELVASGNKLNISQFQVAPVICYKNVIEVSFCGKIGVLNGQLNQEKWLNKSFFAPYVGANISYRIYDAYHAIVEGDLYKTSQKLFGTSYSFSSKNLSLGFGYAF